MKCSIKGCEEPTATGDNLFCNNHRFQWREYCERHLGGQYNIQSRSDELIHLGLFQGICEVELKQEGKK